VLACWPACPPAFAPVKDGSFAVNKIGPCKEEEEEAIIGTARLFGKGS